jgi:hypothetical protein
MLGWVGVGVLIVFGALVGVGVAEIVVGECPTTDTHT